MAAKRASSATCGRSETKVKQLTQDERSLIDKIVRTDKKTPTEALRRVNAKREKKGIREVEKSTVHRFCRGLTHKVGAKETRGRSAGLSAKDKQRLDRARRKLIQKANNQYRVTHAMVMKEAGLEGVVCQRVCEEALRAGGARYRPPRRKIYVTENDAAKRYAWASENKKRPARCRSEEVKAYVDNKSFPAPRPEAQRKRFRQTMVTGHLRKPSEGLDHGFTKPREKHSFIGIPSVQISAAVASDKVIMWHVVPGSWNGTKAASMCKEHLKPALVRWYGKLPSYKTVEDGDRKGNTSN